MYRVRPFTVQIVHSFCRQACLPYLNYVELFSLCILFRPRQLGFVENEDYGSHTRSLFYRWKTFCIYDIVNFNSMLFMFKVYANILPSNLLSFLKPGTHHAIFVFCWTQRRRKDENRMVCAHQRRSSFVDFTKATVVGPIRKSNRSNNCRMVCAGQRHPSHQPTDHRPITVQNFRDA